VARNICRQVGLPVEPVIVGSEIDTWTDEQLAEAVEHTALLANLSPAQKARVVKAL
jgi:Mg2+-importing ATPase